MTEASAGPRAGVERAAILLLALGEAGCRAGAQASGRQGRAARRRRDGAAHRRLARGSVAGADDASPPRVEQQTSFGVGTDDYVRKVLIEALGADKAAGVVDRILRGRSSRGLEAAQVDGAERGRRACCATSIRRSSRSCCPTSSRIRRRRCSTQLPEDMRADVIDAHRDARWRAADGAQRARRGAREAVHRQVGAARPRRIRWAEGGRRNISTWSARRTRDASLSADRQDR